MDASSSFSQGRAGLEQIFPEDALFDASRDAITGVFDRTAFDGLSDLPQYADASVGLAVIEVDDFDHVVKEHGPEVGNKMLVRVANELTRAFRTGDLVFRVEDDKFAIVMGNCGASVWSSLCKKLKSIHANLNAASTPEALTLSAGACFSRQGVQGWMLQAALAGLRYTKKNGCVGCTLVDRDGAAIFSWKDEGVTRTRKAKDTAQGRQGDDWLVSDAKAVKDDEQASLLAEALSSVYQVSIYVDLESNAFESLKLAYEFASSIDESLSASGALSRFVSKYVTPEYQDAMRRFVDLSTVSDRCGAQTSIDFDFASKGSLGWSRATWLPVKRSDGGKVIYALFAISSVDEARQDRLERRVDAERKFEKINASLVTALNASNQMIWEYDPEKHVGTCYTDENCFGLPKTIKNYPASLTTFNLFHPDDEHLFLGAVARMDAGADTASCDVRIRRGSEYRWYNCLFNSFFDSAAGRSVVILSVTDVTVRKTAERSYDESLRQLIDAGEEAFGTFRFNLTQNAIFDMRVPAVATRDYSRIEHIEVLVEIFSQGIASSTEQALFKEKFRLDNMRKLAKDGCREITSQFLYRFSGNHLEWVEAGFGFATNPVTSDVEGVCFVRSANSEKMSSLVLDRVLSTDFIMMAVMFEQSPEAYIFDSGRSDKSLHVKNFWAEVVQRVTFVATNQTAFEVMNGMGKEDLIARLRKDGRFAVDFDGVIGGISKRLELAFAMADESNGIFIASIRDITDETFMRKVIYDARHDDVTGLYNRKTLFARCAELVRNNPDTCYAMIHFDIRNFRLYNSFFGEDAGDELLRKVADSLRAAGEWHNGWAYGRLESDVFCVLAPYSGDDFERRVHEFVVGLQGFRDDFIIESSIGVYLIEDPNMPIEAMFTRATSAAKAGKARSVDELVYFDDQMEFDLRAEIEISNDLPGALADEQFEVYLQAKFSLQDGRPVGAEALVRWNNPTYGLVSPGRFIPVIERNGAIKNLDRYMWEHVCILLRKWIDAGITPPPVSVNVSRVSMYSNTTVPFLKDLVTRYDVDPKYLELELTESAYMDNPEEMGKHLRELQEFGFKVLMDDFGSGYSSLNTLKDVPFDIIKLDMKFLSEATSNEKGRIVVESVVAMAGKLGLPVIAEGVETREQAAFLKSIGCDYAQGFLFAKPVAAKEFEALL